VKKRLERYTLIKEEARKKQEQLGKLMDDAENLCQQLLDLCYYPITDKKTTVLRMRRQFPKLINGAPYLQIIPIQSQLTFTLPASGKPNPKHHPFPEPLVHSLQRLRSFFLRSLKDDFLLTPLISSDHLKKKLLSSIDHNPQFQ
jgi:hypothetical protein